MLVVALIEAGVFAVNEHVGFKLQVLLVLLPFEKFCALVVRSVFLKHKRPPETPLSHALLILALFHIHTPQ